MATRDPSLVPNTRTRSLGGTISILQSGKPVAISKATRTDGNHRAIGAKSDRTTTAESIGKCVDPLDDLSPAQVVNQRDTIASANSEELAVVRECQHVGALCRVLWIVQFRKFGPVPRRIKPHRLGKRTTESHGDK